MVQDSDRLHPNAINAPLSQPAILTPDQSSREQKLLEEIATLQNLVAQLQRRNDDLMEAELALQERESQFQVLVEHSQDIIYVHSADGIFSYVSPSIQTVLGYAMAETVGKSFLDWIHPHDLVRWWNILESIQRHQEPILGQPMRMRHIDQTWRWLTINVTPILDENQQITGYQGIARNITERFEAEAAQRRAQDQVKSTHDFLSGILNHIPDPIFVKDQQGKFILVNRAFCRLLSTTPQEVMGRFNHEILPLELARVYQVLDQTTLKTAAPQSAEITYTNQAEQQVFLYTNQRLYRDAQGSEFLIGIMRDLTDYKNTKEALGQVQQQLIQIEKMSSLGMMVAGIAHEIKSPLNFVAGNLMPLDRDVSTILHLLDLYQQEVPQPSAALAEAIGNSDLEFLREDLPKLISSIRIGTERMQDIVQSLQKFAHRDTDEFQAVNLQDGLESTLLILKPRIKACGDLKEVQIHRHYNQLPEIQGHPGQLNQVFMNLLNNAIDAIESRCHHDSNQPDGSAQSFIPTIEIRTLQIDDQVQIQIIDNGIGISETNQARLFQEAFTTKAIGKGTGMGLSISHQIITQHHQGKLICESQVNQGTTMTITLPI